MAAPDLRLDKQRSRDRRSSGGTLRRSVQRLRLRLWGRRKGQSGGWAPAGILSRILLINVAVLIPVSLGMSVVTAQRTSLTDEREKSLLAQGRIVSLLLADQATTEFGRPPIESEPARQAMKSALENANIRGRLFLASGEEIVDTRYLFPRLQVEIDPLPLPGAGGRSLWPDVQRAWESWFAWIVYGHDLPVFDDKAVRGIQDFPEVTAAIRTGEEVTARRLNLKGAMMISVAVPVKRVRTVRGVLQLTTEAGDVDAIVAWDRMTVILLAMSGLMIGGLASYFMARSIARPIRELAAAAENVRKGDADETAIPDLPSAPREIKALAASFRAMTAALTERLDAIETFAADVSHEIKNPLTSIRSAIETLARTKDTERAEKLMKLIQNDVRRIDRLISDISEASRLDAELSREKASVVDLASFLQMILSLYQDQDPPLPVTFDLELGGLTPPVPVHGREGALAQVFRNILDNAISFSPPDGRIKVALTLEGRMTCVAITDEGPGIPLDSLDKVFQRFYTHRPAAHGFGRNSGLGLAISKQIVESHGGTISAANRTDRTGAIFTVSLPVI